MQYLILTVLSSSLISVMIRLSEGRIGSTMGMFVVNYLTCAALASAFAGRVAVYTTADGFPLAMGLGCAAGVLFLLSLVLLQLNIRKNGVAMASTFMKLGVVISTLLAVVAFHERPVPRQIAGMLLAVPAILLIQGVKHTETSRGALWLPLLLVCSGVTDSMANVFDEVGAPAVKDYYLFYTFATALVCALIVCLIRHERIGRREALFGLAVGVPNYFSSRFLLMALHEMPAVVVYPVVSVGTIVLVSAVGVFAFHEKLSARKLAALGMILVSIVLLNG